MTVGWLNPWHDNNATSDRPAETDSGAGMRRWFSQLLRTRVRAQDLNRILAALRHPIDTFGVTDAEGDDSLLTKVFQKFLPLTGGLLSGGLNINMPGGSSAQVIVSGEGAVSLSMIRFSDNSTPAQVIAGKARGTISSPAAVQQNDQIGRFETFAHTGSALIPVSRLMAVATAAAPSGSDMQNREVLQLCPAASVSLTEIRRFEHATGFSMFGANVVINESRHPVLRSYTVGTLPAAGGTNTRSLIYVSDGASSKRMAVSDGTNWRFPDGNVVS